MAVRPEMWALMFGYFVWGDVPSAGLLIGSTIVVASGFFLFWREARMQRAIAAAPQARA